MFWRTNEDISLIMKTFFTIRFNSKLWYNIYWKFIESIKGILSVALVVALMSWNDVFMKKCLIKGMSVWFDSTESLLQSASVDQ